MPRNLDGLSVGRINLSSFLSGYTPHKANDMFRAKAALKKPRKKTHTKKSSLLRNDKDKSVKEILTENVGEIIAGIGLAALASKGIASAKKMIWRRMTPEQKLNYIKRKVVGKLTDLNPFPSTKVGASSEDVYADPDLHDFSTAPEKPVSFMEIERQRKVAPLGGKASPFLKTDGSNVV